MHSYLVSVSAGCAVCGNVERVMHFFCFDFNVGACAQCRHVLKMNLRAVYRFWDN